MKSLSWLLVPSALALVLQARDASACGGCFVPTDESTQVTGHRMAISVSNERSTLWDQITYSGNPASFAWVLPIKGQVDIGLSSDVMFAFLGQGTAPTVFPPPVDCPPPPSCYGVDYGSGDGAATSTTTGTGGSGSGGGSVEVISQETVGPYETVQLSSSDPVALQDWLVAHGYDVPPDIAPIVTAYVDEGFDFLALKLVPGQGVDAMRPVRVTTPGAAVALPLRMVAAGTGAITPVTLWVLGEGRYEAQNFPNAVIDPNEIVWNWDTFDSNLAEVRLATLAATQGFGWLTEAAQPMSASAFSSQMLQIAQFIPDQSGYGDGDPAQAEAECQADLDAMFATISPASLWMTRMHAELPRPALATDLTLAAASDQSQVSPFIQAVKSIGTYECPVYPPCDGASSDPGALAAGGGSCAIDAVSSETADCALAALGLGVAIAALRRRRRG